MRAVCADDATPQARYAGLQAERTALSWSRTALTILANALLALRTGWASQEAPITSLAFALLIAAGVAMFHGAWRRQRLLDGRGSIAPSAFSIVAIAIVAMITCMTGIASIAVR